MRVFSLLAAFCLMLSASMTCLAAERDIYTYTVTFSAGNQGTLSTADGVSISVDGGGDYEISLEDGGKSVRITGLTAANHVRFLNSAASVGDDSKYYVKGIRMGGRDDSLNLAYFQVERDQDYVVAYGIQGDMVQYTVNYVDTDGNELYPPQTYYGNVGDMPVVAYLYVEGYQPQAYNLTRTLQRDASRNVFTFVYSRIEETPPGGGGGAGEPGGGGVAGGDAAGGGTAPGGGADAGTPGGAAAGGGAAGGAGAAVPGGGAAPGGDAAPDGDAGTENPGNPDDGGEPMGDDPTPLGGDGPQEPDGPEDLVNLDDGETPLAGLDSGDGTVAEANSRMWRNTWTAIGIGLAAIVALAVGVYAYRRMHKAGRVKAEDSGKKE